jgi:hypothetical protein
MQVWPRHRENLIVTERYHFFSSSCRQYNIQGQSLTQAMRDETQTEGTLASMLRVLRSVHQMFFDKVSGYEHPGIIIQSCNQIFPLLLSSYYILRDICAYPMWVFFSYSIQYKFLLVHVYHFHSFLKNLLAILFFQNGDNFKCCPSG